MGETEKKALKNTVDTKQETEEGKEAFHLSETWAQDGLQELEDFIEEQGIYIRQ
jgi:hypothetical protein